MNNPVKVRFLNTANVDDHEFEVISEIIRTWGFTQPIHMEHAVFKKYILGRWLASALLKSYGVTQEQFRSMTLSNLGKPYIPNHPVSFNISHSGDLIVCAATRNSRIGVDIEHFHPINWKEYEDCFSSTEWRQISLSANPERLVLEYWTKKESLLKADGRGLQIALSNVVIEEDHGTIKKEEKKWYFKQIQIEGYACHVCKESPIANIVTEPMQDL